MSSSSDCNSSVERESVNQKDGILTDRGVLELLAGKALGLAADQLAGLTLRREGLQGEGEQLLVVLKGKTALLCKTGKNSRGLGGDWRTPDIGVA